MLEKKVCDPFLYLPPGPASPNIQLSGKGSSGSWALRGAVCVHATLNSGLRGPAAPNLDSCSSTQPSSPGWRSRSNLESDHSTSDPCALPVAPSSAHTDFLPHASRSQVRQLFLRVMPPTRSTLTSLCNEILHCLPFSADSRIQSPGGPGHGNTA